MDDSHGVVLLGLGVKVLYLGCLIWTGVLNVQHGGVLRDGGRQNHVGVLSGQG